MSTNKERLKELPVELRRQFLEFCVEMKLLPVISELAHEESFKEFLDELGENVPEWLEVFLRFRETDMENVEQIRELVASNARLCYGKDVTVEKLLEMDETEVALSLLYLSEVCFSVHFGAGSCGSCNRLFSKKVFCCHCIFLGEYQCKKFVGAFKLWLNYRNVRTGSWMMLNISVSSF